MTKFEEEFRALTSWDWINIDLIQKILTRFGNWHSDEEFQELLDKYSNLNDNYEKEVIRSSKLETSNLKLIAEGTGLLSDNAMLTKKVEDLKSQLQQQALPVVPEFVGSYIEECKENRYALNIALDLMVKEYASRKTELSTWVMNNQEQFAKAWFGKYEVEKPQLFEVKMPIVYWDDDASQLTNGFDFLRIDKETDEVDFIGFLSNTKKHTVYFTEQEIKSIDERYWQFAVLVEDGE
jgi:hypothetical protein